MYSDCVVLRPNAAGTEDAPGEAEFEAIKRAVENWHKATMSCSYLTIDLKTKSASATPGLDKQGKNENVIFWVEKDWEKIPDHDPQAAGLTTVFFVDNKGSAQDGRILDADIELNGDIFTFSASGEAKKTDIENTVTHELGHLMGLDHPCDDGARKAPLPKDHLGQPLPSCYPAARLTESMRNATMYNFAIPGETIKRTPEIDDVKGICETYPRDKSPGSCQAVDFSPKAGCRIGASRGEAQPSVSFFFIVALLGLAASLARKRD